MWSFHAPAAVLGLVAFTLLPSVSAKPYPVHVDGWQELHNTTQLEKRDCSGGVSCGWYGQLCCYNGASCYEDANQQAQCGAAQGTPGSWTYWTTAMVQTDLVTKTVVYSSYIGGATPAATPAATPGLCSDSQQTCGSTCCTGGYYCLDYRVSQCALIAGGSSGGIIGTLTPSAPLRPTSSTLVVVTATPTATVPFQAPIPTGVNGTLEAVTGGGGGLSGGAIAGIVIGVILGIILLLLLCLFCCARAAFEGIMAILGLRKKDRRHTHEETYIEEHHHASVAGGGGRRWYGAQPARPNKPKKSGAGNLLGVGAALGGIALALGLKRKHDKRHDEKSTTVSGSSAYYSEYTSTSEYLHTQT
jgi:ubiquitin-activating enzyme E1